MKILGLIPARGGSKGIKNKNIRKLVGMPLIAYSIKEAKRSKSLTRILVTTDSERIARFARSLKVEVPFIRPKKFSGDNSPALEYINHCLKFLREKENYQPDIIVIVQPTAPLRRAFDIDACVKLLRASGADSVVSVTRLSEKFHPSWQLVIDKKGFMTPFTRESFSSLKTRRQDLPCTYVREGAVYALWTKTIEKYASIYGRNVRAYVLPQARAVNIDDWDDWRKAEELLKKG